MKIHYVQKNLVEARLVFRAEDYFYSSAADYACEKSLLANMIVARWYNNLKTKQYNCKIAGLQCSAKALNEAVLPATYSNSNKVLDIVVMKGKFDLNDLDQIWKEVRSNYPNVKEVRFEKF